MRLNRRMFAAAIGCIAVLAGLPGRAYGGDVVRVVHPFSTRSLIHMDLTKRVPEMESATDFSVRFEIYSSSELGDGFDILFGLYEGRYDFLLTTANLLSASRIDVGPLGRSDLFESFDKWQRFPGSSAESEVGALFEENDLQFAGSTWLASDHLISVKPINSMNELRGLKVRVNSQDIGLADALEAWGASAVRIGRSEVYWALEAGVVDGAVQPLGWFDMRKIGEVGGTVVKNPMGGQVGWLLGRENWRQQMDPFTADHVQMALSQAMVGLGRILEDLKEVHLEELEVRGANVAEFDVSEMAMFREVGRSAWRSNLSFRDQRITDLIDDL